jgi:hypothetical protein
MLARHHRVIKPIRRRHRGNGVDIIVRPAARKCGMQSKMEASPAAAMSIDTTMPRDLDPTGHSPQMTGVGTIRREAGWSL